MNKGVYPPNSSSTHGQEARADSLYAAGHLSEAVTIYQNVLECEPGRLDIRARLGRLALFENKPRQAIAHLAAALNGGLRSRTLWEKLADAYLANGEPGSAALCYERAGREGLAGTLAVMAEHEPGRIQGAVDCEVIEWLPGTALPVIRAEVNGVGLNLLVDTAASDLVLDEQFAISAEIPHGGREQRLFAGGLPAWVTYGHTEKLQLDSLVINDLLTHIQDLQSRFAAWSPQVPIQGILGVSVLRRFNAVFDYRRRNLRLCTSASSQDTGSGRSPIWIADNQFIFVRSSIPEIEAAMWVVDTGISGAAFALSAATARAAGLTPLTQPCAAGIGGGGRVAGERVILPRLRVAGFDRSDLEGVALGSLPLSDRFGFKAAGLLASDYFMDAVLSLDFFRMTLRVD